MTKHTGPRLRLIQGPRRYRPPLPPSFIIELQVRLKWGAVFSWPLGIVGLEEERSGARSSHAERQPPKRQNAKRQNAKRQTPKRQMPNTKRQNAAVKLHLVPPGEGLLWENWGRGRGKRGQGGRGKRGQGGDIFCFACFLRTVSSPAVLIRLNRITCSS